MRCYRDRLANLVRYIDALTGTRLAAQIPLVRKQPPRTIVATPQEFERLMNAAPPWLQCWLRLTHDLSLRNTEARSITPANYNPEKQTITYRAKGGRSLELPITEELRAIFDNAPATDNATTPYLELLKGSPVTHAVLYNHWRGLKRKAAVNPDLVPHDLRRTRALAAYETSKDIRLVQQLLGHTNITSTAYYLAHRDPEKLRPLLLQLQATIPARKKILSIKKVKP